VGDAWTLSLGDCLSPDGLASLADGSVDHVICDPPYEAEAHTLQRRVRRGNEPLSFEPLSEETRAAAAAHIARVARRWILVFCQVEAAMKWRDVLVAAGAVYRRSCVWIKPDGMPQYSGDRPGMGYETIIACHAPGRSRWNGGGSHGVFINNKHDADRSGHETQKPGSLMEKLVALFTDPGDLVCDPFAGSGTTGVAAIRRGRRFIGWERDPKYHAVAVKRLSAAREQLRMFEASPAPGEGVAESRGSAATLDPAESVKTPKSGQTAPAFTPTSAAGRSRPIRRVTVLGPDGEAIT
jgi:site-specific DNA-methyltransferase (adenine-specific)